MKAFAPLFVCALRDGHPSKHLSDLAHLGELGHSMRCKPELIEVSGPSRLSPGEPFSIGFVALLTVRTAERRLSWHRQHDLLTLQLQDATSVQFVASINAFGVEVWRFFTVCNDEGELFRTASASSALPIASLIDALFLAATGRFSNN